MVHGLETMREMNDSALAITNNGRLALSRCVDEIMRKYGLDLHEDSILSIRAAKRRNGSGEITVSCTVTADLFEHLRRVSSPRDCAEFTICREGLIVVLDKAVPGDG